MSSNCFYLHNEAKLSILLIFERGKSKSALDKQLPPPSPPQSLPPTPNLCVFSLNAGFLQVFGLLRGSETTPRTPSSLWGWVLGVLPWPRQRRLSLELAVREVVWRCQNGSWREDQGGIGAGKAEPPGWRARAQRGAGSCSGLCPRGCGQPGLGAPSGSPADVTAAQCHRSLALPALGCDGTGPFLTCEPPAWRKGSVCTPGIAGWGDAPALGPRTSGENAQKDLEKGVTSPGCAVTPAMSPGVLSL